MTATISRTAVVAPRAVGPSQHAAREPLCFTKPGAVDLCVYRGDSGRIRVRITDDDGAPVDVTAATWDCDFRTTWDNPEVLCSLTVEPVAGQPGAVDLVLTSTDSALLNEDCVWDLEMTLDANVTTILAGKVKVTKDVSRPGVG